MKEDGRIFGDFLYRQSPEGRLTAYYCSGRSDHTTTLCIRKTEKDLLSDFSDYYSLPLLPSEQVAEGFPLTTRMAFDQQVTLT
jgi:hypothetical protein